MDLVAETEIDGQLVRLALWWTSDTEEYERLGALSYADSDVILICFAIDDLDSFEKVAERVACLRYIFIDVSVVSRSPALLRRGADYSCRMQERLTK